MSMKRSKQRGSGSNRFSGKDDDPPPWSKPEGPEPTRFGDWEKNGRCIDF